MQHGSTKSLDAVVDEQAKPPFSGACGVGPRFAHVGLRRVQQPRSAPFFRERREARLGPCGRSAEATGGASRAPDVRGQRCGWAVTT
jgi:hypothetical protein